MKINYKLKNCLMILSFIFIGSSSIALNNLKEQIIFETGSSWVAVHDQNGIKVTCTPFNLNGSTYIRVKFENITTQVIDFSWSLKKGNKIIVDKKDNTISPKSFIEIDNNILIPFDKNSTQADFLFEIL